MIEQLLAHSGMSVLEAAALVVIFLAFALAAWAGLQDWGKRW